MRLKAITQKLAGLPNLGAELVMSEGAYGADSLGRTRHAESLGRIICALADHKHLPAGRVVAVDAPWGSGKTWLAEKLPEHLRDSFGIDTCVYVNAFEFDYHDQPFVVLASAILSAASKNQKTKSELLKAAKDVVVSGAPKLAKGMAKKLIGVVLDEDTAEEVLDWAPDAAEKSLDKLFDTFEESQKSAKAFRAKLEKLGTECEGPLVVMIDELDRCRPTFALEMLERVKHLFNVPNVVFVLFFHASALESAIETTYGAGIDASAYLRKFISVTTQLPQRRTEDPSIENYSSFFGSFLETTYPPGNENLAVFNRAVSQFGAAFSMTLRDVQNVMLLGSIMKKDANRVPVVTAYALSLWLMEKTAALDLISQIGGALEREYKRLSPKVQAGQYVSHVSKCFSVLCGYSLSTDSESARQFLTQATTIIEGLRHGQIAL